MATAYTDIAIRGGDTATPLNLRKRLNHIRRFMPDGPVRFLDCGCGKGDYVAALVQHYGFDAWGIEYLAEKLVAANPRPVREGRILRGNIERIPFDKDCFDGVLLNEVLEHVPHERAALQEIRRVLKPDGRLVIFSPNRLYPFETHGVSFKRNGTKIPHWMPLIPYIPLSLGGRFLEYPARNYWPSELVAQVAAAGFTVVHHAWVWQTFENISGAQPRLIRISRPLLRKIAAIVEEIPIVNRLGVSQVLVAKKGAT